MISDTKVPLVQQIRENAFSLPRGCFIHLEKIAQETVLSHIERSLTKRKRLVQKIARFEAETEQLLNVKNFLMYYDLDPSDIYQKSSFRQLCSEANLCDPPTPEEEEYLTVAAKRLLHLNSISFIRFIRHILAERNLNFPEMNSDRLESCISMLYYSFHTKPLSDTAYPDLSNSMEPFFNTEWIVSELDSLLAYLEDKTEIVEKTIDLGIPTCLSLHCRYSRDQIFAGLMHWTPEQVTNAGKREGVVHLRKKNLDVFFITLNKSEKHFSPSTMYNDYAISETLFHWQSQSTTSESSSTGHRYINHVKMGSRVLLFVREFNKINNVSQPYECLGTASYVNHEGSKPMSIVWQLDSPMPARLLNKASKGLCG